MSYYSKYSWYQPQQRPQGGGYSPYSAPATPQQMQQQEEEDTPSINSELLEQMMGGGQTAPVESFGSGNVMLEGGGNYTPVSGNYSPTATSDPFSSGGLQQTQGADFFSADAGSGMLSGGEGALSGGEGILGGGEAAAGGGESMMGAAGWAALLAAAIAWNEEDAREGGYRDESQEKRLQHQFSGKVVEQDVDRWSEMLGTEGTMLEDSAQGAADLATLDFSNAARNFDENEPFWNLTKESLGWLEGLF